jgi:phosphonate transport system permease protein
MLQVPDQAGLARAGSAETATPAHAAHDLAAVAVPSHPLGRRLRVFALMFVVAVGLGPFAGVMAIFVHNLGVFSKLFSEAVEAIDPRPVEGIRATGARRVQEVVFGVVPQVLPLWSSLTLYRLETNVRSATTLGIVGAGGIGQTLYESIRSFQYAETAAQIIIVVVAVVAIDLLSARIRRTLV